MPISSAQSSAAESGASPASISGVRRLRPFEGLADPEVLTIAAPDGRILVSHDFGTMPRHFRSFVSSRKSPGLFPISEDEPVGRAVESLVLIWKASEAVEWENQITYLPV